MTAQELSKLSIDELLSLNKKVIAVIKAKRKMESLDKKDELYVGAKVEVNHPKMKGKALIIDKINRTKAVVKEAGTMYGGWNVPISMITLIS